MRTLRSAPSPPRSHPQRLTLRGPVSPSGEPAAGARGSGRSGRTVSRASSGWREPGPLRDRAAPGVSPQTPPGLPIPRDTVRPQGAHVPVLKSESRSGVADSLRPHGLYSPGILQATTLEWASLPFSSRSYRPGIEPRFPCSWELNSFHLRFHHQRVYSDHVATLLFQLKQNLTNQPLLFPWASFTALLGP